VLAAAPNGSGVSAALGIRQEKVIDVDDYGGGIRTDTID